MKLRLVAGVVVIAAVAIAAWFTLGRPRNNEESISNVARAAPAPTSSEPAEATRDSAREHAGDTPSATPVTPDEAATLERRAIPGAVLGGRVVDANGQPIRDATVSWTTLPGVLEPPPVPDWESVERATVWARSNSAGEFSFADAPDGALNGHSVVWASHPGFVAAPIPITADSATWTQSLESILQASSRVRARVVDGSGQAVRNATVWQRGIAAPRAAIDRAPTIAESARMVLFRTSETADDGSAELAAFAGEQTIHAEQGTLKSPVWRGSPSRDVALALYPTFSVEGRVHVDSDEDVEGGLRLSISAHFGGEEHVVLSQRVSQREPFGPFATPLLEGARYSFLLNGGGAIPVTEFREAPEANSRVVLQFSTSFGSDVYFKLIDEKEQVITSGSVAIHWDQGAVRGRSVGVQRDNWPGFILVRGCPNGLLHAVSSAPGFADDRFSFTHPPPTPFYHLIPMVKAGRIEGRVLARGKPVPEFEMVLWPTSSPALATTHRFADRDDGTFVIDSAPMGGLTLVAASERHGRSNQVRVEVRPDVPATTEVELLDTMLGRGRVVDESGNAISTAEVQLYFYDGGYLLAPWGVPYPVDSGGAFEVRGLPEGHAQFVVSAPGFSQRKVGVEVEPAKDAELGKIVLYKARSLEVRLREPIPADATKYAVECIADGAVLPREALSHEGRVVFPSVDAGWWLCRLIRPDGAQQSVRVALRPGRPWLIEFDAGGTSSLVVDLDVSPDAALPEALWLHVQFEDAAKQSNSRYANVNGTERITVEGLPAGSMLLRLEGIAEKGYASTSVTIGEGERREVRLTVSDHKTHIRVLNRERDRVPAAYVSMYDPAGGPFQQGETTDANGECDFAGLPDRPLVMWIYHETFGSVWALPFHAPSDSREIVEIVFDPDASVQVRLLDGDAPAEGVVCNLHERILNRAVTVAATSDAGGNVRWNKLGRGDYRVIHFHNGYWPIEADVTARVEGAPSAIQIRRLGDAQFTVRSSTGLPVVGQSIRMRSIEFDADVGEWARAERVGVEPRGMITDSGGRCSVRGLPHGGYRWEIDVGNETLGGLVEVPRGGAAQIPVTIP